MQPCEVQKTWNQSYCDLHALFDKENVNGATKPFPEDVSADHSSDEDVVEIGKTDELKLNKQKANKKDKEEVANE